MAVVGLETKSRKESIMKTVPLENARRKLKYGGVTLAIPKQRGAVKIFKKESKI